MVLQVYSEMMVNLGFFFQHMSVPQAADGNHTRWNGYYSTTGIEYPYHQYIPADMSYIHAFTKATEEHECS